MRDRTAERRLIRYLHGELPAEEVRKLRAELARDPALQARLAELHRLWQGLQPSAPTPAPFGYVPKLQRLAEEKRATVATSTLGWGAAPPWVRAMAGAALVAGIVLGVGLGRMPQGAQEGSASVVAAVPSGSPIRSVGSSTSVGSPLGAPSGGVAHPRDEKAAVAAEAPAPSAAPSPARGDVATPGARETMAAQRGDAGTAAVTETESAESMLADGGSYGGSSTTLAEEYWQALEGTDDGSGGGEGDAGW